MDKQPLKPAKLHIWDLDNVIYPYDDAFNVACDEAAARAACALGLKIELGAAIDLAGKSYREHGSSFDVFIREHGLPEAEMYRHYHDLISLDFLKPDKQLNEGFRRAASTHAILTHGTTDWANRVLAARRLSAHFKPEHIIGIDQVGFCKKSDGTKPFEHVLALTGHNASDARMIEDTAKNLKHAKAMGIETVFISYGKGDGDGHADHVFATPHDYLEACNRQIQPSVRGR